MPTIIYKPKNVELPEEMYRIFDYNHVGCSVLFRTSDNRTHLIRGKFSKTESLSLFRMLKHADEIIIYVFGAYDEHKQDERNIQPFVLSKDNTASSLVYFDGTYSDLDKIPGYEKWMSDNSAWFNLSFKPLMGQELDPHMMSLIGMLEEKLAMLIVTPDWKVTMLGKNKWHQYRGLHCSSSYVFNSGSVETPNYHHSDSWRKLWKALSPVQAI